MKLTDEEKTDLKTIIDHFDEEDKSVRERQLRTAKQLKLYWDGIQRIWFDEVAHDWKIWPDTSVESEVTDSAHYDKPVNVFRALIESIIAALSITIPPINCAPDDADNPLDISTAKAGQKIADLIFKHNDAELLWLHALYIFYTEGMIACYTYPKEDEKYGTYEEDETKDIETQSYVCENCGTQLPDELFDNLIEDEFMPDDEDSELQNLVMNEDMKICPQCAAQVDPNLQKSPLIVTRIVGVTTKPKTRICMETYGTLFVKIPNYAMKQSDMPYLIFSYETHYANALSRYPELADKFSTRGNSLSGSNVGGDPYERWARLSTQYRGEYPTNTVTIRNVWLRECAYQTLAGTDRESRINDLKKKFPSGCKVIKVDDECVEAFNESLDDCWTLTKNPMSDYINHDPLGFFLVSVQDVINEIISLTIQTIEHGIGQTFADPAVLNFNEYGQTEVLAGGVYPAKPKSGKSVADAFHSLKTATLSGEVLPFSQKMLETGQLVSGALPSLFGGEASTGSKTAAEYSMSRAQAQQRLQIIWKMLRVWWKEIFGKAIPAYIKEVVEDEKYVTKDESGNYVNVFIRKAELQGKIGGIELDPSDQLPVSWAQKKDAIMQLLTMNNPIILEALTMPENIEFLKQATGLNEFELPGEDDRQKQYEEIRELLDTEPIQMPPDPNVMMAAAAGMPVPPEAMQGQEVPSVQIDPELDNHQIESDICKRWLKSDAGRLAKIENPAGYKNVLLHMKMHLQELMMQMMQQQMMNPDPSVDEKGASNKSQSTPKDKGKTSGTGQQSSGAVN